MLCVGLKTSKPQQADGFGPAHFLMRQELPVPNLSSVQRWLRDDWMTMKSTCHHLSCGEQVHISRHVT